MSPPRSSLPLGVALVVVPGVAAIGGVVSAQPAGATSAAVDAAAIGPCDVPLVGTACDVIDGTLGIGGDMAAGAANAAIGAFASWMATGITELLRTVTGAIFGASEVDLFAPGQGGAQWFGHNYGTMAAIGLAVFAPMLLLAVLHALFSQSGAVLGRALFHLPVAAFGTAAAVALVQVLLDITDGFSSAVLAGTRTDTQDFLSGIFAALTPASGGGVMFGSILIGLFLAFACLVVWVELVVREAAIYLAVMFLPLGFAAYIWPALSGWLRRLVEVIVALVLSKLVIAAALGLAASALANQEGFAALVAGAGMFLLAAFAPFALFKLIPVGEMAAMSALEGQGRKAVSTGTPRLSTAYYVQGMRGRFARSSKGAGAAGPAGRSPGGMVGGMAPGGGSAGAMSGAAGGGAAAVAGPVAVAAGAAQVGRMAARAGGGVTRRGMAGATSPADPGGARP